MKFERNELKELLRKVRAWLTAGNRPYRSLFDFLAEEAGEAEAAYNGDPAEEAMMEADGELKEDRLDPVLRAQRNWAAALYRDTRFSTAGHRFLMAHGAHNRMRAWYETADQAETG